MRLANNPDSFDLDTRRKFIKRGGLWVAAASSLIVVPELKAAITIGNNKSAGSSDTTNVTTAAISTVGANLIVAVTIKISGGSQTFSDNQSNSYTALTVWNGSSQPQLTIYYKQAPTTNASHTFTLSGGATYPALSVAAFAGVASSPFDQQNGNNGAATTTLTTGSITPGQNNELVIAGLGYFMGSTVSINGGFTIPTGGTTDYTVNSWGVSLAYLIQTSAAAANPQWAMGTPVTAVAGIATFKSTAATGSLTPGHGTIF